MFETQSFKNLLTNAVAAGVAESGLAKYEPEIIDYLQQLASENENTLMEREVRKIAGERRGVSDAVSSAEVLATEACKYAAADKRTLLKVSDVQAAYKARFCHFWPFCKS